MLAKHRVSLRQRLCRCYSDEVSPTKNTHSLQSKSSQNKRSKFRKMEKLANFPTLPVAALASRERVRDGPLDFRTSYASHLTTLSDSVRCVLAEQLAPTARVPLGINPARMAGTQTSVKLCAQCLKHLVQPSTLPS